MTDDAVGSEDCYTDSGDAVRFVRTVCREYALVYAVLLARVGDRELARDLSREVFLHAWFCRRNLPKNSTPWFRRFARRVGRRWTRLPAFRRAVLQRYKHVGAFAPLDLETAPPASDLPMNLLEVLAPLRKRDRELVVLDHMLGHATRDAARALGLGHRRAQELLRHARKLVPPHHMAAVGAFLGPLATASRVNTEAAEIQRSLGIWAVITPYIPPLPFRLLALSARGRKHRISS